MTPRFRQVFSNRHVILPVIHVETTPQALRNALLARMAARVKRRWRVWQLAVENVAS